MSRLAGTEQEHLTAQVDSAMPHSGKDPVDEQERAEVANLLSVLPQTHPARRAFESGDPTWKIVRLLRGDHELVVRLSEIARARSGRMIETLKLKGH